LAPFQYYKATPFKPRLYPPARDGQLVLVTNPNLTLDICSVALMLIGPSHKKGKVLRTYLPNKWMAGMSLSNRDILLLAAWWAGCICPDSSPADESAMGV